MATRREPQRKAEFDQWGPRAGVGVRPKKKLVTTPMGNHPLVDWGTFPHKDEDKGDWKVATWAVDRLQEMGEDDSDQPFFLACGFFLPHVPCYATQKWFDLYPMDELKLPPMLANDRSDTPDFSWYLHWTLPEPRASWLKKQGELKPLVRAYLASVSFVDSQVGRVLDALEQSGQADNTVVVLWSDHGWHLGEKAISGKNSLWEESTRVPLIFAGPGVAKAANVTSPAELLDLYPTLSELCGLSEPKLVDGHSLVPQLKDATAERTWPAITTHNVNNHSIRTEHLRYIRYADGSEELYDLARDPNEWKNVVKYGYEAELRKLRKWVPVVNQHPVPGSKHRILVREGSKWIWEGKPIDPTKRWE